MPIWSMHAATSVAPSEIVTPRASNTSAPPLFDDAARLPCLTTGTPAAATTIDVIVEMFTVCERSPPVPTMSIAARSVSTRVAWSSIACDRPASSAGAAPFIFTPTPNAAICADVALSVMTSFMAHRAWSTVRSMPSVTAPRTCGQV